MQSTLLKMSFIILNKHTACAYSIFTKFTHDTDEDKQDFYRGQDCMKEFCKTLRDHAMKIINYKRKNDTISK